MDGLFRDVGCKCRELGSDCCLTNSAMPAPGRASMSAPLTISRLDGRIPPEGRWGLWGLTDAPQSEGGFAPTRSAAMSQRGSTKDPSDPGVAARLERRRLDPGRPHGGAVGTQCGLRAGNPAVPGAGGGRRGSPGRGCRCGAQPPGGVERAGRPRRSPRDGEWLRAGGEEPHRWIARAVATCRERGAGVACPGRAMAGRPGGAPGGTMKGNNSALLNASQQGPGGGGAAGPRPSWLASTLAFILIFTIVVDILGNLLVILSVYRNKKLRNAGRGSRGRAGWTGSPQLPPDGSLSPLRPPAQHAAPSAGSWLFLRKVKFFFLKNWGLGVIFFLLETEAVWFTSL